jgi:putative membrane-bound dehydrogenase-like protein
MMLGRRAFITCVVPSVLCVCAAWAAQVPRESASTAADTARIVRESAPTAKLPSLRIAPKEPGEAAKTFQVRDGFHLDLLAAEPLTTGPVAMEYDEDGRAYVVEMCDYPYTDRTTDKPFTERTTDLPLGRVRLLEDTDGDGRLDRSTIFADNLSWPTGLALWKGGVYVAGTPELVYLKDTDGDRRADVRRVVFSGFSKFNVQAVVNNLRWGLDHRIYGAGGGNGGTIRRGPGLSDPHPVKMTAQDFRFEPNRERLDLISGGARFGQAFDDWGNRFVCNIRNPIRHAVIDDKYFARNPLLPVTSPLHDVADAGDTLPIYRISRPEPWRVLNARRLAADPASPSPRSETVAAGYVTSACGITLYRGTAYPPGYYGQAFLGEVAANVIHRQRLEPQGMTFRSTRIDSNAEFVASTDNWFRPVNFTNAPDGTLHVLDMYRETIEHPWSIPDDIKQRLDLESGRDRGRIYRLAPAGFAPPKPPRLRSAGVAELMAALGNANAWWRDTAHRLIFERQDRAFVAPLKAVLRSRNAEPGTGPPVAALARLHALWSLHGLGALDDDDLAVALDDPSPGVRAHAIGLAEPRLPSVPGLRERVFGLAGDSNLRVRAQAALSLGNLDDDRASNALATVAQRDPADDWIRLAVLSAKPDRAASVLVILCRADRAPEATVRALAVIVGARAVDGELRQTLESAGQIVGHSPESANRMRREVIVGLSEGLARRQTTLEAVTRRIDPSALSWIGKLVAEAATLAGDARAATNERVQAVTLVGLGRYDHARRVLAGLLDPTHPQEVQLAAVRALARHAGTEVPADLIAAARGATPLVRAELIDQLLSRREWISPLLDAIERRAIAASEVPLNRRTVLVRNADSAIKARALRLFVRESPGARGEVVARYRAAFALPSDRERGHAVAKRVCFNCHRLGTEGSDVGPALETIKHRSPEEILLHVFDPNREVTPGYLEYVIERKDGRVTSGAIAAESASSITLRREAGRGETILRTEIAALASTGKSVMPEGLESQVSIQEMADLLAFLLSPVASEERSR